MALGTACFILVASCVGACGADWCTLAGSREPGLFRFCRVQGGEWKGIGSEQKEEESQVAGGSCFSEIEGALGGRGHELG